MVAVIYCRNGEQDEHLGVKPGSCRWYNTAWPIQINPDGTVPIVDHSQGDKTYPGLLPAAEEQRMIDNVQKQLELEQQAGAEVRNPRSQR